ncbi:MAG: PIG-L family deacetylase [Thermomicrobiales bacterium]|nr:PIG-L family deacetylase [Thermomicrobiales bacterium]
MTVDILYILAHPDDESFGHAGTMLLADQMGISTGYICATRGEAGKIRDAALATQPQLAARRDLELRRAMKLAKLDELRVLGYRDSGMDGTPENEDPRCLIQADEEEVTAHLVMAIRDLQPKAVIGFGPDGVYGHPDHIRIGKLTDRAIIEAAADTDPGLGEPWQVPAFYHVAAPRERILASRDNPESPYHNAPLEVLNKMGSPEAEITHWTDTSSVATEKYNVLMQHATQITPDSPVAQPNHPLHQQFMSTETLIRRELPWTGDEQDPISRIRDAYPATHQR